jgi:catechol 2,3-dioxygenase-like lactoylglutathione lyase family enzyme
MSSAQIVFDHVHIICKDPEAAATWYADMLGGTITRRGEVRGAPQIAVQFAGATILVRGQRPGEQPGDKNALQHFANFVSHDQWGTDHFGFKVVGDLLEFCNRIKEKGGTFAVEPYEFTPGTRIAYLAGPDGVSIELVESKAR